MENHLVPAFNPGVLTGRGNNTWLIEGDEPALVDAGIGEPAHIEAISAALQGRALARVLVTHGHPDHASGVPTLRRHWPHLAAFKWILEGQDQPESAGNVAGWTNLRDGDQIAAGDSRLTVIHTPGHALDHVCFWNPETRSLYSGDMVVRGTTIMIPASLGGGLRAYLASLERIAALNPARIFPGHGPVIDDPLTIIAEYIAHRRARDEQVAACLRAGIRDPDAIVLRVYPDLAPALIPAARATVLAHIEKLQQDGL